MSDDQTKSTIITVMAANIKCGTVAPFVENSRTQLVTLGNYHSIHVYIYVYICIYTYMYTLPPVRNLIYILPIYYFLGVNSNSSLVLSPDWGLVAGLLGGIYILMCIYTYIHKSRNSMYVYICIHIHMYTHIYLCIYILIQEWLD
jgi:hypothetical protein